MATPVLETRHLTKVYDCLTAVDDLNLELRRGEILGFLGPNGAGKTTTINMICGLTRPTEGQVLFDGVGSKSRRHLSSLIGFCSQDTVLWESLTCLEQLTFMGEMHDISNGEARRRGRELLDEVGL